MASFESPELRVWRPGSEAWLCRWQGRLGWFTSSLRASVSSSENSRGGLDGVSGPGRSEFLWLQHLDRLSTWCPQSMPCGHCSTTSSSLQDQKGFFPAGVCCGWTDMLTSPGIPGIPRGTSISAVTHSAFKICFCYTRDFSQKYILFTSPPECLFSFSRARFEEGSISWRFPAPR